MPELPEVETSRRGIEPHLRGQTVHKVVVRDARLRWPIPANLNRKLAGQRIDGIERRGKYLLIHVATGSLILHLGMSGSLRVVNGQTPAEKHDHFDLLLTNGKILRLRDPRRFGAVLFSTEPLQHKLLVDLGPEPLGRRFNGKYLFAQSRNRKLAVKNFIMDSKIVVGVGNIYASEALFIAGIHPGRPTGRISAERYEKLASAIKQVLRAAIKQGGTTLRDFTASDGKPGYFKQKLNVYGRNDEPCPWCGRPIKQITLGQRASYYCTQCQT